MDVWPLGNLRSFPFRVEFFLCRPAGIGMAKSHQFVSSFLVAFHSLRLAIRTKRPADFRPFVPEDAEPAKPVEDRLQRFRAIALDVRVIDAQHELAAEPTCQQPVE